MTEMIQFWGVLVFGVLCFVLFGFFFTKLFAHIYIYTQKLSYFSDPVYSTSHKQLHWHNQGDSELW